jgi:hypothetical protein
MKGKVNISTIAAMGEQPVHTSEAALVQYSSAPWHTITSICTAAQIDCLPLAMVINTSHRCLTSAQIG